MQAGEPRGSQLAESPQRPRGHLAAALAGDVLQTLQSGALGLTRRPSRIDNHRLDVRPLREGSVRVVHAFDAHFDVPNDGPAAGGGGGLQIEEVIGSGDIADRWPMQITPQLEGQQQQQQQGSRLAAQESDAASQTECEDAQPGGKGRQLSQPTLVNVNDALYRRNLTR